MVGMEPGGWSTEKWNMYCNCNDTFILCPMMMLRIAVLLSGRDFIILEVRNRDRDSPDHVMKNGIACRYRAHVQAADGVQRMEGQRNLAMLTVIRFSSKSLLILPNSQSHHASETDLKAWQAVRPLRSCRPYQGASRPF